ncbi:MAG: hypothetical protein ACRDHL_10685, partial [Candidatus Promineifilaceae bacterium]
AELSRAAGELSDSLRHSAETATGRAAKVINDNRLPFLGLGFLLAFVLGFWLRSKSQTTGAGEDYNLYSSGMLPR